MHNHKDDIGPELVFLLRQQRSLYHQLRAVAEKQRQVAGTGSPELLLKITSGRRKLIEKLREVETKLQLIKANWPTVCRRIGSHHKAEARTMQDEIQAILGQIQVEPRIEDEGVLQLSKVDLAEELRVE